MLVVDANIFIAALLKDGKTREIIVSDKFTLISPDYLHEELNKYKDYIRRKARISKDELELLITLLLRRIRIVPQIEYKSRLEEAQRIMKNDLKDAPYVACYLALKCDGIWTSDPDYEGKSQIKTVHTADLNKLL